jgi:hypothetical protein
MKTDREQKTVFCFSQRVKVSRRWNGPVSLFCAGWLLLGANARGAQDARRITLDYAFDEPVMKNVGGYASLSVIGCRPLHRIGKPALPFRTARVLLPSGAVITSVEVAPMDPVRSIRVANPLTFGRTPVPIGVNAHPAVARAASDQPDVDTYASDDPYPVKRVELMGVQKMNGYDIALVRLYPVQYRPASATALFCPRLRVIVMLADEKAVQPLGASRLRASESQLKRVRAFVDNPDVASVYETSFFKSVKPLTTYDYLLVTTVALTNAFQPLVAQKISDGLSVKVATVEDILAGSSGVDSAAKLRSFITYAYTNWNTTYVLLGGDISTVPYRQAYASCDGVDATMPCDLYFACLDGSWNSDGDSNWGEPTDGEGGGDVDLLAEVYVGRAPVDTVAEVANFIGKTLYYEQIGHANADSVRFLGEYLGNDSGVYAQGGDGLDSLLPSFDQYNVSWLDDRPTNGATWDGWAGVDALNESPHIVAHDGHSNQTYAMRMYESYIDSLNNTEPFLVYSMGCYCGAFDYSDCFAEELVKRNAYGAFSVIMNSRYGWFNPNNEGMFSGEFMACFFDELLVHGKRNIGEANQLAKQDMLGAVETSGDMVYRWCYFEITLFGDPHTMLQEGDDLRVTPGAGLDASGPVGGPFTPSNTVYALTNAGSSTLSWSALHAQSWITVSPASGSLAPGQGVPVTVALNLQAGQLAPGVFNDCVSFSNLTSLAVKRRDVALTVQDRVLVNFAWDVIAPTQYVGTAFGVTVTARDATGNTLDDFTGTVPLRAFASNPSSRDVVTGASEWDFPLASWYHDARTQVIYLKSEVGEAALLTGLSLRVTQIPGQTLNAWTIRLKHTPQSAYAGTVWEGDSWVVALQTNITISATGWVDFTFTTPFYYNGMDNLMVDFSFNNSSYTVDGLCWSTTVGSNRCLFFETDSQYGDPLNWAGVWPSGSVTNRVPTIRLDRRSPVAIAPKNAVGFVNGLWHGDITVPQSATGLFLFADAGLGRAGNSGVFDVVQAVALQEALDQVALAWTTGGSADWMGQTNVTHDGEDAARSGSISHRETTWMQTQVTGPGEISFWWRVSSEANWDWLEFYVNGVLADRISGETGWLKSSVYLTNGTHTLIWCYMKDGLDSDPVGQDCGWVDQVTGPLVSALPLAWLDTFGLARNGSVDFVDSDGDGFTNWQEWFADTVPTNARSLLRLEGITPEPDVGGFRVRWQSVTGKRYWVESCTNLIGSSPFIPFVSNIWGEVGGVTEIHDPRPLEGPARFYRVGVQPE